VAKARAVLNRRSSANWICFTWRIFLQPQPLFDLHTLREVSLRETHSALRQDICRLRQAAYAASFVEQATETETPLPAVLN